MIDQTYAQHLLPYPYHVDPTSGAVSPLAAPLDCFLDTKAPVVGSNRSNMLPVMVKRKLIAWRGFGKKKYDGCHQSCFECHRRIRDDDNDESDVVGISKVNHWLQTRLCSWLYNWNLRGGVKPFVLKRWHLLEIWLCNIASQLRSPMLGD